MFLLLECSSADSRVGWIIRTAESLLASGEDNTDNKGAQHLNISKGLLRFLLKQKEQISVLSQLDEKRGRPTRGLKIKRKLS